MSIFLESVNNRIFRLLVYYKTKSIDVIAHCSDAGPLNTSLLKLLKSQQKFQRTRQKYSEFYAKN